MSIAETLKSIRDRIDTDLKDEFQIYKAKYLSKISHEYINNEEMRKLYNFIAKEFYELYKYAQKEHNKFFWLLNDPIEDYEHYTSQAKAWGIPTYSFEKNKQDVFNRVTKGLGFIRHKGTEAQVSEMLSIILLGKENWKATPYQDQTTISIDIMDINEEKIKHVMEYLDESIPPYIKIEFIEYMLPKFVKKYKYDEIITEGGSSFIEKELEKYIIGALMLPHEAFRINKSKLNEDLIKVINETIKEDRKVIFLFRKDDVEVDYMKKVIEAFFHRDEARNIFVLSGKKEDYEGK